ncbi:MAG TPA: hypothetical protein VFO87_10085 [Nitrospira sp.]|nr:hypothetical protein [Nitrospira sp.]
MAGKAEHDLSRTEPEPLRQRVAKKHGEVSQAMFNRYVIDAITNGVHAVTWVSEPFATLYDRYIAGWNQIISACATP